MVKRTVNSKFFQEWSSKMAYILGVIVADGSVIKRKNRKDSYVMNITSKDRSYLEKIRKAMSARCKLGLKRSGYTSEKNTSIFKFPTKKSVKI